MYSRLIGAAFCLAVLCLGVADAAEYRIGPGDVLQVNFWQDPTLNSEVRVSQAGTITLDIIGETNATGKTTEELQNDIVRHISRLNKRISQAVVRVMEYNHLYVFVSGQVNAPGKQTFEEIPDLWTIVNEAGGITGTGDLSRVTIIRGGDKAGQVEVVDVTRAIATGRVSELPKIGRGDTIEIPRTPAGFPSADIATQQERRNLIYVVGAVAVPGPVEFYENTDLLEAIALAGGPTEQANLKKAKVISKDGFYAQTTKVNLEKYTELGRPARYILGREDVVVVPRKSGFLGGFNVATVATLVGLLSTSVLVYTQLNDDNTTTNGN